jgi:hypothetical protein
LPESRHTIGLPEVHGGHHPLLAGQIHTHTSIVLEE